MTTDTPTPAKLARLDPLMYTAREMADVLHISERLVHRKHAAGELPAPVRLGRLVRWPKQVVDRWIADGCPKPPRARR